MGIFDFIFGKKSKKAERTMVERKPNPQPKPEYKPARTPVTSPNSQTKPIAPAVPKQQPKNKPNNAPITYVPPVSSSQQDVLDYLSNNPRGITFVHGKAGCGKPI